jgi:hypothetical protein
MEDTVGVITIITVAASVVVIATTTMVAIRADMVATVPMAIKAAIVAAITLLEVTISIMDQGTLASVSTLVNREKLLIKLPIIKPYPENFIILLGT